MKCGACNGDGRACSCGAPVRCSVCNGSGAAPEAPRWVGDPASDPDRKPTRPDLATDDIPRHLRLALAHATDAFDRGDMGSLATINENVQPLVDAAIAWGRRTERDRGYAEGIEATRSVLAGIRRERDELIATLANERGEGDPPSPGWEWCAATNGWTRIDDNGDPTGPDETTISRKDTARRHRKAPWLYYLNGEPCPEILPGAATAREAMCAVDARRGE